MIASLPPGAGDNYYREHDRFCPVRTDLQGLSIEMDIKRAPVTASARRALPPVIANAIDYPHGTREPAHTHPRAQLIYSTSGMIRVRTPGASWVVTPTVGLLVMPFVSHELEMVGDVAFRTLYLTRYEAAKDNSEGLLVPVTGLMREAIVTMTEAPVEYAADSVPGVLAELIERLLREVRPGELGAHWQLPMPAHPRLRRICEALLAEPGNNDTLERWADRIGASSRTVSRLFQRETGVAFAKWREHMRVCEAMCRLSTGGTPGDVASALGYADTATFATMFRRVLGVAPHRYQSGLVTAGGSP